MFPTARETPMENRNSREHPLCRRSFLALAGGVVSTVCLGDLSALGDESCRARTPWRRDVWREVGRRKRGTGDLRDDARLDSESRPTPSPGPCVTKAHPWTFVSSKRRRPGPYHGAVVGSAIRSDRWLPEAKGFVERNSALLSRIPTAYFLTCLTLALPPRRSRKGPIVSETRCWMEFRR